MLTIDYIKQNYSKEAELSLVTLGLYTSYIYFGVLQEHM